jgi:hypothetical protein
MAIVSARARERILADDSEARFGQKALLEWRVTSVLVKCFGSRENSGPKGDRGVVRLVPPTLQLRQEAVDADPTRDRWLTHVYPSR